MLFVHHQIFFEHHQLFFFVKQQQQQLEFLQLKLILDFFEQHQVIFEHFLISLKQIIYQLMLDNIQHQQHHMQLELFEVLMLQQHNVV